MDPLPQLTPGALFARDFRVVRPLSAGGMGAVYVVEQVSTRRLRALKIMLPGLVQDPKNRERFTQEASVSGRIRSDHVVEVVAAGIDDATGTPWLAMELLEGEDLQSVMNRAGPLSVTDTLEIFRQLCHGLGAAHRAGLVHRDLKPENVFLAAPRRQGVAFMVKILDFGIAKVVGESRTSAMATSTVGSPLWMSPEQAEQGSIRPATDIWALGLMAFYLLTGRFYWRSANGPHATLASILREVFVDPIDPPSQRAAEYGRVERLPTGFDGWFARCVTRDAGQRYRDGDEALAGLIPVLGMGVTAPGYGASPPLVITAPVQPPMPTMAPPMPPPMGAVTPVGASGPLPWGGPPSPFPQGGPYGPGAPVTGTVGWQPGGPGGYPAQHPPVAPRAQNVSALIWLIAAGALTMVVGVVVVAALAITRTTTPGPVIFNGGAGPSIAVPGYHPPTCSSRHVRADVPGLAGVTQISAGRFHTCAVINDGTVRCWGWNATRQLGDGTTEDHYQPTPVPGLTHVAQVAAGDTYTCALITDGTVRCWGITAMPHPYPTQVEGLDGMTTLAAGVGHACGRRVDGSAWCWGRNSNGELGDGTTQSRDRGVRVDGLAAVAQLAPGGDFTCALVPDGTVWCWGSDDQGQLGDGHHTRDAHTVPTMVPGLTGAVRVAAGEQHACALLRTGTVQCWGWNEQGQLGYGAEGGNRPSPAAVPNLQGVMDLSLGYHDSCVRRGDGTAWCWGENFMCQLGTGPMTGNNSPVQVPGLDTVADLAGGGMHTCARMASGAVRCWGFNMYGQLANGTTAQRPDLE